MLRIFLFFFATFIITYFALISFQNNSLNNSEIITPAKEPKFGDFTVSYINAQLPGRSQSYDYKEPLNAFKKHTLKHWFQDRDYHVYMGEKTRTNGVKPAIVLLHGSGRTGISMLDMWSKIADRHNVLLIAPDSATRSGWSEEKDSAALFEKIIDDAEQRYGLDRQRLYLFGHSAGGVYATFLAIRENSPFKAIATHAGFPSHSTIKQFNFHKGKKPPITYFLGDKDHIFSVDSAINLGETLEQEGYETNLTVLQGHNHWYYDIGPEINEKAWRFFKNS